MTRQDKKIYFSLMNSIASALLVNQLVFSVMGVITNGLDSISKSIIGDGTAADIVIRLFECVAYFVSFVIPVALFNKMNKNANREIYEPVESESFTLWETVRSFGIALGGTILAAYVNYFIVNLFVDYSEFSQEYFWAVDIEYTYQAVIYFIYIAIIPAVVEELLFRETICKSLMVYGNGTAVVVSAVLFSLMHTNIEQMIYSFIAGLLFGWVYVKTKKLFFPILVHFLNNGISALSDILYDIAKPSVYNTYSTYKNIFIWVFMFVSVLSLLVDIIKKGSIFTPLVMKPDENGETVAPLTLTERVSGFFTVGMLLYVAYSLAMTVYYIYLSIQV